MMLFLTVLSSILDVIRNYALLQSQNSVPKPHTKTLTRESSKLRGLRELVYCVDAWIRMWSGPKRCVSQAWRF